MMRTARRTGLLAAVLVVSGCGMGVDSSLGERVTPGLQQACPAFPVSAINAIVLVMEEAKAGGASEFDALLLLDDLCGDFVNASVIAECVECYTTVVDSVYGP